MYISLVTFFLALLLRHTSCQNTRWLKLAANAKVTAIYVDGKALGNQAPINKHWSQTTILSLPSTSKLLALTLESKSAPKAWIMADSNSRCVYATRPETVKCATPSAVSKVTRSWFTMGFNDFQWPSAMVSRTAQNTLVYPNTPQFCQYAQWLWTATSQDVIHCRFNITHIDVCKNVNGGCSTKAQCTNIPGGRICSCNAGYSGNGVTCTDINECLTDNGGCSVNEQCVNTPGNRTCSCKAGYSWNGLTCDDINECITGNGGCSNDSQCTNIPGNRTCSCNAGYSGTGWTCDDINECIIGNGGCSNDSQCTNIPGNRTCSCNAGFSGNGWTCVGSSGPKDACSSIDRPVDLTGTGILTSPNYPNDYPPNSDCQWRITAIGANSVVIVNLNGGQIVDYDYDVETYLNDGLALYDGYNASFALLVEDWAMSQRDYSSTQMYMFVKFWSDDASQYDGFSITYRSGTNSG